MHRGAAPVHSGIRFNEWNGYTMKSILKQVDRFCYRHPRFGVPNLMIYIVIGNLIVWLFGLMDTTNTLYALLLFDAEKILHGQIWRLVTFLLIPQSSSILWLALSLYFYYFVGSTLEREWGSGKFTIYYFSGVVFMLVYGFLCYAFSVRVFLTSYYLNLGMFFVFATFYPDTRVLLFYFIPVKVKWLALLDLLYFAADVVTGSFPSNLLPVVVLLHYVVFCGGWLFDYLRPRPKAQRQNTTNFKAAVRKMQYEQKNRPYTRRCEVCGRTDADYPDLEFRYCSKCQGYHCFCIDHINNHKHFTE